MLNCKIFPYKIHTGLKNMAIDESMAKACIEGSSLTLLRFYGWSRPTLSLGYAQKSDEGINIEYCNTNNIDIVKRPTGGSAVLHANEITYCIASTLDNEQFSTSILTLYKKINTAIIYGLNILGIEAEMYIKKRGREEKNPNCFATFAPFEILVNNKKIAGSAQRRFKKSFIQHGSIIINLNKEHLPNIFNGQTKRMPGVTPFETMTSIQNERSKDISKTEIINALTNGFIKTFNFTIEKSNLSPFL